jgi:transglutaminase-like putative cysteine protease
MSVACATRLMIPSPTKANQAELPPASWRTVDVVTRFDTIATGAASDLWVPIPLSHTGYQELISTDVSLAGTDVTQDYPYLAEILHARAEAGAPLKFEVKHRLRLRDRTGVEPVSKYEADVYLKPTKHIQTDGIVRDTAREIVGAERDPVRQARLIYDWIIDHTYRDPKVRGCGVGDVALMLKNQNFGGKCVDLSSLFVGLCRAVGIPAREVFGVRVLASDLSPSIGKAGDVSKAQHCRAEFYSKAQGGWIPVDCGDVRKVILEDKLAPDDPKLLYIRDKFFGFWEMNWIGFNAARDFTPAHAPGPINFLMYPLLISGDVTKDGVDPLDFNYQIQASRVS